MSCRSAGCHDMCATSYSGPECMCSTGSLGSDGRSCSGFDKKILTLVDNWASKFYHMFQWLVWMRTEDLEVWERLGKSTDWVAHALLLAKSIVTWVDLTMLVTLVSRDFTLICWNTFHLGYFNLKQTKWALVESRGPDKSSSKDDHRQSNFHWKDWFKIFCKKL